MPTYAWFKMYEINQTITDKTLSLLTFNKNRYLLTNGWLR